MDKNNLYDWVFYYNPYTDKWNATTRDNYTKLFSDQASENVIRSSKIDTLISLITKAKTPQKINNFVKGQIKHIIVE